MVVAATEEIDRVKVFNAFPFEGGSPERSVHPDDSTTDRLGAAISVLAFALVFVLPKRVDPRVFAEA
jgi:hypothetical protein